MLLSFSPKLAGWRWSPRKLRLALIYRSHAARNTYAFFQRTTQTAWDQEARCSSASHIHGPRWRRYVYHSRTDHPRTPFVSMSSFNHTHYMNGNYRVCHTQEEKEEERSKEATTLGLGLIYLIQAYRDHIFFST